MGAMAMATFKPPFLPQQSLFSHHNTSQSSTQGQEPNIPPTPTTSGKVLSPPIPRLILPAAYVDNQRTLKAIDPRSLRGYLEQELDVSRLNKVHKHLWLTSLPIGARPLHRQVSIGRKIVVVERADLHLVWRANIIFVKPLPDFLMDHEIWTEHLCQQNHTFQDANGFLLSYLWLICSQSDFKIAHEKGLLSSDITWAQWTTFSQAVMSKVHYDSLKNVNPRYLYGEIRLSRLNWIYRLCTKTRNTTTFIRGYEFGYYEYSTFLQRNFAWLLVGFIYITIVLTAMQVGLATKELQNDRRFNRASYGFTVFAILAPLAGIIGMSVTVLGLVVFNSIYTIRKKRSGLGHVFENDMLKLYNH
jgi:succinate dehydrogenase/fumarate reductase cytochrome b subunit